MIQKISFAIAESHRNFFVLFDQKPHEKANIIAA